jgi:hypothetical protein
VAQSAQTETAPAAKIETNYDSGKDRTTVKLASVQISGEKDKYHSLHMSPWFSFPGRHPERPAIIGFELQTVVKTKLLDTDLYVVFIIDGETIFLSSNRWAVARPVPGRLWIGERLVFRMPYPRNRFLLYSTSSFFKTSANFSTSLRVCSSSLRLSR